MKQDSFEEFVNYVESQVQKKNSNKLIFASKFSNILNSNSLTRFLHYINSNTNESVKLQCLKLLATVSQNPHLSFELAKLYENSGDINNATILLNKLCESSKNPWHHIKNAEMLHKNGQSEKSIEILLETFHLNLNDKQLSSLNKLLAEIYVFQNETPKAFKAYIQYLLLQPGDTKTYYEIADLLKGLSTVDADFIRTRRDIPKSILKSFYPKLKEWTTLDIGKSNDNTIWYKDHEKLDLSPPGAINNEIHYTLKNTKGINRWASFVIKLDKAYCSANDTYSYIESKEGGIVQKVSIGGSNIINRLKKKDRSTYLQGTTAFLSQYFGAINYCHWVLDILPRVGLLEKCGYDLNQIDQFVFNNYKANFQIDSLNKLGINDSKIITSDKTPELMAENALIPSLHMHPANSGSPWVAEYLQNKFLESTSTKSRRIYINRTGVDKRKVINEKELIDFLETRYGFENITMHNHNIFEQARIANEAEIIIGPHGAALTNIVFSNPGTKIVEIFSPVYGTWTYYITAFMAGLDYYNFIGNDFDNSIKIFNSRKLPNSFFGKKDILVDLKKLDKLLNKILN